MESVSLLGNTNIGANTLQLCYLARAAALSCTDQVTLHLLQFPASKLKYQLHALGTTIAKSANFLLDLKNGSVSSRCVHVQLGSNSRSVKQKSTLTTSDSVGTNNANFGGHSKPLFYLYTLMSETAYLERHYIQIDRLKQILPAKDPF
jgi:hypothetical protein